MNDPIKVSGWISPSFPTRVHVRGEDGVLHEAFREDDGVYRIPPAKGHIEWPEPEPCGPPSDPHRSHIYRAPRWVRDEPEYISAAEARRLANQRDKPKRIYR